MLILGFFQAHLNIHTMVVGLTCFIKRYRKELFKQSQLSSREFEVFISIYKRVPPYLSYITHEQIYCEIALTCNQTHAYRHRPNYLKHRY